MARPGNWSAGRDRDDSRRSRRHRSAAHRRYRPSWADPIGAPAPHRCGSRPATDPTRRAADDWRDRRLRLHRGRQLPRRLPQRGRPPAVRDVPGQPGGPHDAGRAGRSGRRRRLHRLGRWLDHAARPGGLGGAHHDPPAAGGRGLRARRPGAGGSGPADLVHEDGPGVGLCGRTLVGVVAAAVWLWPGRTSAGRSCSASGSPG